MGFDYDSSTVCTTNSNNNMIWSAIPIIIFTIYYYDNNSGSNDDNITTGCSNDSERFQTQADEPNAHRNQGTSSYLLFRPFFHVFVSVYFLVTLFVSLRL